MRMIPVSSSNLESVGYENGILCIAFHGGRIYEYTGVPESVYQGLMAASSHGKYFHAYIRNLYPYSRIAYSVTLKTSAGPSAVTVLN